MTYLSDFPPNTLQISNSPILEKQLFMRERHHQIKNNPQMVSRLLSLQSKHLKDDQAVDIFKDTQNRVKSISLIHERLYESKQLKAVNFGVYVRSLMAYLFDSFRVESFDVSAQLNIEDILLPLDKAIPCGLIVSELVSNSLKYAFPPERKGRSEKDLTAGENEIRLDFTSDKDRRITLRVGDSGIGFPEGLDFRDTETFGLQLVCTLVDQLEGRIVHISQQAFDLHGFDEARPLIGTNFLELIAPEDRERASVVSTKI